MTRAVAAAGARMGGITRLVLGHEHPDHRGIAPELGVPVYCHPDGGRTPRATAASTTSTSSKLKPLTRAVMPRMLQAWDGGPVQIAGTVAEGDDVAGFEVIHLPGHAPGQIGLWRESDRLALVERLLLHARPRDRAQGPPAPPARGVQPGHRAGARVDPQARGAGAVGGLAGARRSAHRRRARRSSSTPPPRPDGQARPQARRASTSSPRPRPLHVCRAATSSCCAAR